MGRMDRDEVVRLAALARVALTEEEVRTLAPQLAGIVEYVERLRAVDTSGVEPTSHGHVSELPLRDDVTGPSLTVEQALGNAKEQEDGYLVVPRILGDSDG